MDGKGRVNEDQNYLQKLCRVPATETALGGQQESCLQTSGTMCSDGEQMHMDGAPEQQRKSLGAFSMVIRDGFLERRHFS